MSDFLGNLVARSLSPVAAVRPQVMSIFEPLPEEGAAFRGSTAHEPFAVERETAQFPGEERLAQLQSLSRGTPEERAMNVESLSPESHAGTLPPRPAADEIGGDLEAGEVAVKHPPVAPPSRNGPAEHREIITPHEDVTVVDKPAPVAQKRRNRSPKSPAPASLLDEPADKHSSAVPLHIRKEILGTTPHAAEAPNGHSLARAPSAIKAPLVPVAPIVPAQKSRPALLPIVPASIAASPRVLPTPIRGEAKPGPPSIHVTIGRVEVRAIPPPVAARSRSQPAAAPAMGLDEYLRQRAAGARR